ncbi:hypothetical protein GOC74_01725 [Halomicrobium mukohataei]|uniref:Uncharacterized protein n=1 Tax=Halomicrobium mukohataei TaxID=57705 RepID=A0A847U8Q7_9EURY|nr:hypothetical protein [Halomicrobium mukohataei]
MPLYEDQQARDDAYYEAEAESTPFFAVERYEEGYAITYDLLPAGYELSEPMRKELNERVTRKVEDVVGDEALATVEVSRSIGASLGNVSFFQQEATARDVAAVISRLVLAEENWVEADEPADLPPTEIQKN